MKILINESQLIRLFEGQGTIDRILDKINERGIYSLTNYEKRILDDYSKGIKEKTFQEEITDFLDEQFGNLQLGLVKDTENGGFDETTDESEAQYILLHNDFNNLFFYEYETETLMASTSLVLRPVSEIYMLVTNSDTLSDYDFPTMKDVILNWFAQTYADRIRTKYPTKNIKFKRMDVQPFDD